MKILAVDTSANVASVALCDGEKLIAESILNHKKTHSEKIMPMIDRLLLESETDISEIDLFAVAKGPGSFTGLRIGISTVKALAHAVNKPIVGISTLEGLAYNLYGVDGVIAPIMDARRAQVYNGIYTFENGVLKELAAPRALAVSECIEELKTKDKIWFLGDGVPVHKEEIVRELGKKVFFAPASSMLQRAGSLAELAKIKAALGDVETYQSLAPVYLRKPQAERELEEKKESK